MVDYIILRDTGGSVFSQPIVLRAAVMQNFEFRRNVQKNVVNDTEFVAHIGRVNPITYNIRFRVRPKQESETVNVPGVGICKYADWFDVVKLIKEIFYDPTNKQSTLELSILFGSTQFPGFSTTTRQWIPVVVERISFTPDYRMTSGYDVWEFEFVGTITLTEV